MSIQFDNHKVDMRIFGNEMVWYVKKKDVYGDHHEDAWFVKSRGWFITFNGEYCVIERNDRRCKPLTHNNVELSGYCGTLFVTPALAKLLPKYITDSIVSMDDLLKASKTTVESIKEEMDSDRASFWIENSQDFANQLLEAQTKIAC